MALRFNIAANYASQFYGAAVGILLVPVYINLMGAEAYGLVAFFLLLQSWFQLLDAGLTATMTRETARYHGGACDALTLRSLLRSLEILFWAVGGAAAIGMALASPAIASRWLNVSALTSEAVTAALIVMAFTLAIRWICGLYRGVISGLERQVWLAFFNMAVVTARFVGVVPVLLFVDARPMTFFLFQAVVSGIELAVLVAFSYSLVPLPGGTRAKGSWRALRSIVRFAGIVAFTSSVWVFVTQTDKLLLSRLLSLEDYGYFTAAVLVASGITLLGSPIAQALLPRLTRLSAEADDEGLFRTYRQATQAVVAIAGSSAVVLAAFAEEVLWVWTGDGQFASRYASVVALYAAGNALLASAAFPYYLQFAKGDLRLHLWGNAVFLVLLIPAIIAATSWYGAIGAAAVWAGTNALFFLGWTPLVHRRFAPGLHGRWLRDILATATFPLLLGVAIARLPHWSMGRLAQGVFIIVVLCGMIAVALLRAALLRPQISSMLSRWAVLSR